MEEIREQVDQEKKQAESGQRFAVIFQMVQGAFNDLLGIAAGMGTEEKEKYKNACRSMAQAMENTKIKVKKGEYFGIQQSPTHHQHTSKTGRAGE